VGKIIVKRFEDVVVVPVGSGEVGTVVSDSLSARRSFVGCGNSKRHTR